MGRGPSYPFVDLEEAIGLTRKIYDYTKRSSAPSNAVVEQALKYSLKSSGGVKTIAALKSYGLIEESEGNHSKTLKITDRAYRILVDEATSPERIQAVKDAALSPKWYQYCWEKWGDSRPPSMRSTLLIDHGFVPSTVDSFLQDYEKTLKFAGISEGLADQSMPKEDSSRGDGHIFSKGDYVQWESKNVLQMPKAKRFSHYSKDGQFAFVEGDWTGIPSKELISAESSERVTPLIPDSNIPESRKISASGNTKMQIDTLSLAEGITLQFQWPESITKETYDDFLYQLEGFKRRVARAVKSETKAGGQSED
jgi:hypothetical protein